MDTTHTPWWGKIGLLWLIFVPLCMAIYVLAQPLAPNDLWYHLRAGAWMMQHYSFPRVALFTPSVPPDTPYFYQSWLAEIVMYITLKCSGLSGLQILRAICFTSAFTLFVVAAQRRAKVLFSALHVDAFNDGARRIALVAIFVLFMCIPNTDLRPQSFSLPLFAAFAAIIFNWTAYNKHQLGIRALGLSALMMIWANTHGAFATGLILLLLFCGGETVHYCAGNALSALLGKPLSRIQLKMAWLTFAGSAIAACINPEFWKIYAYVYNLTSNAIGAKYIQEWQPPTWRDGSNSVFFCCAIATVLLLLLLTERFRQQRHNTDTATPPKSTFKSTFGVLGVRPGELCLLLAFFVMGLRNVRSIIWFALIFLVMATALLCRVFPPKVTHTAHSISPFMQRLNALLAALFGVMVILFLPALKPLLPWPESYRKRFAPASQMQTAPSLRTAPPMMLAANTPLAATAFLQQHPPTGLLWNDMVFGSYLVWALPSQPGPWADPRVELRPDRFWYDYIDTSYARNKPATTLIEQGFSDVLINKETATEKALHRVLTQSPQWRVVYEDDVAILFRIHHHPQR